MMNLTAASRQWATRPADERFATLGDLKESVLNRRQISHQGNVLLSDIRIVPAGDNLSLDVSNAPEPMEFTHWSFGQVCQNAKAPASYLRTLPTQMAADCINYSLPKSREAVKLLLTHNGKTEVRALTSTSYGRIWDIDVVNAVEKIVSYNQSWHTPPARFSNGSNNAGLYASDRDVWMFFVDEDHKINVNGDLLSRGFFMWNSEVGKCTFGLTTFLYRYVCGNHIVWSAQNVKDIRIKHSSNAPSRAVYEVLPALKKYAESSVVAETETLQRAIEYRPVTNIGLQTPSGRRDKMTEWLQDKGFTKSVAQESYDYAMAEEGDGTTLWNIVQGLSAMARDKKHIDERVEIERKAGNLLNLAK